MRTVLSVVAGRRLSKANYREVCLSATAGIDFQFLHSKHEDCLDVHNGVLKAKKNSAAGLQGPVEGDRGGGCCESAAAKHFGEHCHRHAAASPLHDTRGCQPAITGRREQPSPKTNNSTSAGPLGS